VGDFNAAAGANKTYDILTESGFFTDTWLTAGERRNERFATFHDYRGPREGARIDWILARGPVEAVSTEIVTFSKNGQYPSDHFPVAAWLRWSE
jgi:endonuclease/exonuclease/phosphatase family metal-dependent hydrolase